MAKKHKNLENIPIRWNGTLNHPDAGNKNANIPANIDLGVWGDTFVTTVTVVPEHVPVWEASGCTNNDTDNCASDVMDDPVYFEDYDIWNHPNYSFDVGGGDGALNVLDGVIWGLLGRDDIKDEVNAFIASGNMPDNAPEASTTSNTVTVVNATKTKYTWGDVNFVIEIADGIGTGSRRAREARLNQFDKDKKKKLIRLICRVKGEKVYDEEKEVGDTYIKLEDADLVINEVLGKIKVEKADVL